MTSELAHSGIALPPSDTSQNQFKSWFIGKMLPVLIFSCGKLDGQEGDETKSPTEKVEAFACLEGEADSRGPISACPFDEDIKSLRVIFLPLTLAKD